MSQAQTENLVKVHYVGRDLEGNVFDSSREREPLEFTIGEGRIIPGFEEAVVGMTPGDLKTVTIAAEQAYGPYRQEMVQEVSRTELPDNIEVEVGTRLQARQPDDSPVLLTVTEITEDTITLDANHPLAGKDLVFEIELVEVVA